MGKLPAGTEEVVATCLWGSSASHRLLLLFKTVCIKNILREGLAMGLAPNFMKRAEAVATTARLLLKPKLSKKRIKLYQRGRASLCIT